MVKTYSWVDAVENLEELFAILSQHVGKHVVSEPLLSSCFVHIL